MPNEKHEWDNRSNQLNPNNDAYYQSRGYDDKADYDDCPDDDDDYLRDLIIFNKVTNDQQNNRMKEREKCQKHTEE